MRGGQSLNFAVPVELAARMLHAQQEQPKRSLIPLQTFADLDAVDASLYDLDLLDLATNQWTDAVLAQWEPAVVNTSEFVGLQSNLFHGSANWKTVFDLAKSLVAKNPESSIAHAMLAHAYNGMGFQEEALEASHRARMLDLDSPYPWNL